MSTAVLIIGKSGTGKSTSIRTLPAEKTFIINVLDKPLPFRGSAKKYIPKTISAERRVNYVSTDQAVNIIAMLKKINNERHDIKYIVIDDFGYVMTNEFMSMANVKGYDKFNTIAHSSWSVLHHLKSMRSDLTIFVTMHSDQKEDGIAAPKTIGKMTDDKVCIEGMFTYVLHSLVVDKEYKLATNHNGAYMAKSPYGIFDMLIENDMKYIADTIHAYNEEDIDMPPAPPVDEPLQPVTVDDISKDIADQSAQLAPNQEFNDEEE
jgi:hypothetical protein